MSTRRTPKRLCASLHPLALAALLASGAPAAQAADRWWTFIGGCGSADWFSTTQGPNSQGQLTCWATREGGSSGAGAPTVSDDVIISAPKPDAPLLVSFAAPARGGDIVGQSNSVTLKGGSLNAAGLQVDRGSLITNSLTLGVAGGNLLGQLNQSAGLVAVIGSTDLLAGGYNLSGGTFNSMQLNISSQTAGANFTQTGGKMIAGNVNIGSLAGSPASFEQLAGTASSSLLNLGTQPGTTAATLNVSGAKSTWSNSGATVVGALGAGALKVSAGGTLTSGTALIGAIAGADGLVTVQDKNSRWKVDGLLSVGTGGDAQLVVKQGAFVSAASLDVDNLSRSGEAVLLQGAGTTLSITNAMLVGRGADASIALDSGATLIDAFGVIGDDKRSLGKVDLLDSGTTWTNTTSLVVGDRGRASVTIGNGARVYAAVSNVGFELDANGSVSLDGDDSLFSTEGVLTIGQGGIGKVDVGSGSLLKSESSLVGMAVLGSGQVTLAGGNWSNQLLITLGQGGQGTLEVKRGGALSSGSLLLAEGATSVGTLTLQDKGSRVDIDGALTVGKGGSATLSMLDASVINSGSASFGEIAGGIGIGTLGASAAWFNRGELLLGGAGSGRLDAAGPDLSLKTDTLTLGRDSSGDGQLNLGVGSIEVFGKAVVGGSGSGSLNLSKGARLSSGDAVLGAGATGSGQATLDGTRASTAQWTITGKLTIGDLGKGTLTLQSGGVVDASGATSVGKFGRLQLNGGTLRTAGLTLFDANALDWRSGTLNITGDAGIALGAGALPSTLQLKAGKVLDVSNELRVGSGSRIELAGGQLRAGKLALDNGSVLGTAPNAALEMNQIGSLVGRGVVDAAVTGGAGKQIVATGTLSLGHAAASNGFAYRGTLDVGGQTVTLADSDGAELGSLTTLAEGGRLVSSSGFKLSGGGQLQSSGNASIQGGFANGGMVTSTNGLLDFQGDVNGNGNFAGNVGFEAGFNPGSGIASVAFYTGSVSFGSGSMLTLEINGTNPTRYDRLTDIGNLSFLGGLTLAFGPDFLNSNTARLSVLNFINFQGAFDPQRISITGIEASRVDTSRLASNGMLTVAPLQLGNVVTAVPEPGTWALWLAGLAWVSWVARRLRYTSSANSLVAVSGRSNP